MSRTKALEKVKLTSFDDLFGGKETEKAVEAGDVREITAFLNCMNFITIRFRFVPMRN